MSARREHLTADHDPEIAANPNLSDTPADAFAVVATPGAWGEKFDTGDMVTIMNKRGNSTDATVVDIDHAAFPAMFKIRFNDRRKEEVWKTATELTAAVSGSPAPTIPTPSTATDGDSSAGAGSTNPAPTGSPTRRQSGEIFCAGGIQSHTSICDGSSGAKVPTVANASCSSSVSSTGGRCSGGQSKSNGSFSLSEDPSASRSAIDASLATAFLSMQAAAEVLEQTASLTYGDSNGVKNNHPTSTPSALACVLSNQATDRHGPVPARNDSQSSISMLPSTDEKHAGDGIIHAAEDMIVEPAGGGGIGDLSLASAAAPAVVPTTGSGGTARDDHFNIDDTVIVMDKHGRPSEAKIASVNHSISPALFKICFKDRRKKEAWKPATELITPARCMATPSAAAATVVTASENDRLFHSAPASKPSNQATCGEELATPGSNCRDAAAVLHPTDQLPRRKRVYPTARHPINDTNVLTHDGGIGDPAMVAAKEVTTVVPSEATPTDSFNVADMVIVTDKYGHPANATVMSIDGATSPTLYKLRFKDRRKKEIWKPAVELIASIGGVPVPGVGGAASVANAGSTSSAVYTPSASGPSKTVSLASTGAALSVPPSVTHGNKDEEDGRPTSSFFASALTSNSQAARGEKPVPPRNIRRVAAPRSTDERNAEQRAPSVITVCPADMTVKSAGGGGTGNPATTPTTVRTTSFAATTRRAYFNVADTVIAMDKYGHPVDAVVVGVDDTVSPPLFKVSFKGRRKKEAWKTATELTACAGNTCALAGPAASTAAAATAAPAAAARAPAAAAPAADASIGGNSSKPLLAATRDGMVRENESPAPGGRPRSRQQERIRHHGEKKADVPGISAPTKRSSGEEQQHAASGGPSRAGLQSEKSQKLKRSSDGDKWQKATTNNINNNNNQETYAPRGRDAVSQPLPRRRAAAAAAGAILSTSKSARRKRINPLQQQQSTKKSHNGLPPGAGEQGQRDGEASPARDAATTTTAECGQIPRKLGLSGRKRPRVVTPGFAAAASLPVEPALRETHPTEGIRRRKLFNVQQPRKNATSQPRRGGGGGDDDGGEDTPCDDSSSSLKKNTWKPPRRPLVMPSHPLKAPDRRGVTGADGEGGWVDGGLRRGGRARRQVYPRLCEDGLGAAAAFGAGGNGDDDDEDEDDDDDDDDDDDGGSDSDDGGRQGGGKKWTKAGKRFFTTDEAPWGSGAQPLVKVELSLYEDREPLCAERSALAVVTFVADRHKYSAEQLCNVLTGERTLCYCDEENKVFVLTDSCPAAQREVLLRVQQLASERCGVTVEASPWLEGRRALDEFLDNRQSVVRYIMRHRLATGLWAEVGGVYFYGLFCGRRSKRTFNGVKLGFRLATSDALALDSGVWEIWITVEPAVHRFEPVDWWQLLQEKEERGLFDFSGSKSDRLESLLQVVCLPNLSKGVVYDVQEDSFERDRLQEANQERGYLIGPQCETEMVEYWRHTHLINLPSSFVFVKVLMAGMVLTYPSWCVIRGQGEVAEAAQALHGRILDSFADGLDAMEGITVMETTFTWQMLTDAGACASLSDGANAVTDTQARFTTGNGKVVGAAPKKETQRTESEQKSTADVNSMRVLSTPGPAVRCGTIGAPAIDALATGEERGVVAGRHPPHQQPSVVTPLCTPVEGEGPLLETPSAPRPSSGASDDAPDSCREDNATSPAAAAAAARTAALVSPESAVAAAAAQASVAVIRASVVRRRGALLPSAPKQRLISPPVNAQLQEQQAKEGTVGPATVVAAGDMGRTSGKLCSAPFVIRRAPANRDGGGGGGSGSGSGSRETGTRLANESQSKVPRKSKLGRRVGLGHEDGGGGDGDAYVDATLADRAPQDNQSGGDGTGMKHGDIAGSSTPITPQHAATSSSSGSGGGASNEATPARVVTHGTPDCGADQKNTAVAADSVNETSTTRSSASTAKKPRSSKGKKRKQPAVERPTKLTVTFSTQGSLGMGMAAVDGEEDTYELESKAPTSAAAGVPNGWHFAEVDGKNVRNIGGQKLAELLRNRPVSVTFEKPPPRSPPSQPPRPEDSEPEVEPDVASVPKKRKRASKTTTATASAGTAAATTSDGISRNEGDLAEPQQTNEKAKTKAKPKTKAKSKKSAAKNKVTTVRKVFKVQTVRKEHGGDGVGGSASASASTSCGVGSKNGGAEGGKDVEREGGGGAVAYVARVAPPLVSGMAAI